MLLIDQILMSLGERIVAQLKEDIAKKPITKYGAVNASGALLNSIRFDVVNGVLRVYALDYIYYLEKGRAGGKAPPRDAIVKWIQDKGIQSTLPVNSLAYLIQRKIAKEGTLIYQQGGSDLVSGIINQGLIDGLKSDLFNAIVDSSVTQIRSNIVKLAA